LEFRNLFILTWINYPGWGDGMICKIYGIIDIVSALIIFFATPLPGIIKLIIAFILCFKGVPSLFA